MDPQFWLSSVRDLILLALGSFFTLVGSWLASRHATRENEKTRDHEARERRRAREEAIRDSRGAEDVERGKELLRVLARIAEYLERGVYFEGQDQDFPDELISSADDVAVLIHDERRRDAVTAGVWLLHSWDVIAPLGRGFELAESKTAHHWKTFRALRAVAGALARNDAAPEPHTTWLLNNGAELDAAWEDRLAEQEDWRRDVAAD